MMATRTFAAACFALMVLLAVSGCSPRGAAPTPGEKPEKPYDFKSEGKIPPLDVKEVEEEADIEEMPAEEENLVVEEAAPEVDSTLAGKGTGENVRGGAATNGFRVQVFASLSSAAAEKARESFAHELGVEAYVEYVDGMYKVRLGDFSTRREAEELLARCRKKGYGDAWIVRSRIKVRGGG